MHIGNKYFGLLTDIWSAGVVLYIMNFKYLSFCEDDEDKNIMNIINGVYEIPKEASPELKDFLKHLLILFLQTLQGMNIFKNIIRWI